MADIIKRDRSRFFVSAEELDRLRKIAREANARAGIPYDPTITAAQAREQMRLDGVRKEDNIATREMMRSRYGEDAEEGENKE